MEQAVGQSMAMLSSTYPRYRKLISNRHSQEAAAIPACAISLCPPTREKLGLANLSLTCQVLSHKSACLRAMPNKPYQALVICRLRGCTVPHPTQLQISCKGLHCCLIVLARKPVVQRSVAQDWASTPAYFPSLLWASQSRRTQITPPSALSVGPEVAAGPVSSPPPFSPRRRPAGRPSLRPPTRRARRTRTRPFPPYPPLRRLHLQSPSRQPLRAPIHSRTLTVRNPPCWGFLRPPRSGRP
jgi:hypothetical protein